MEIHKLAPEQNQISFPGFRFTQAQ